jgi:hypothetical protein
MSSVAGVIYDVTGAQGWAHFLGQVRFCLAGRRRRSADRA